VTAAASLVSVVVPTRNSARTLERCLESIRGQDHRPIELIIVDNASTDQTLEIARRYGDVVENFGHERSAQRNRGAALAHGHYLLFVDSDMVLATRVVIECLDALTSSGAPAVIIPEISFGDGFFAHCRALERSCYVGDDSIEAARFYSKVAFEASGGFDESMVAFEDWDLSRRVATSRRLPRTASRISHDEGVLTLRAVWAKKRYYGASSFQYWRKHGLHSIGQINLLFRPAFVRNWRRLVRHPVLTAGFLTLKCVETAAGVWGLMEARANIIGLLNPSERTETPIDPVSRQQSRK